MGFAEALVKEALQVTTNKDQALDFIIRTLEEGDPAPPQKAPHKPIVQLINVGGVKPSTGNSNDEWEDEEEEYKMVFLVRMDLKMGLGKMAAQVGHAALGAYKQLAALDEQDELAEHALFEWNETGQKKVVVKVNTEEELFKIIDQAHKQRVNNYVVRDAGRTQVIFG